MKGFKEDNAIIVNMASASMNIHKGRSISVYRSLDQESTAIHFEDSFFELVVFKYQYGMKGMYLRYPGSDVYVELFEGGSNSSWIRGNEMSSTSNRDVLQETLHPYKYEDKLQPKKLDVFIHEGLALIKFNLRDFNFMSRILKHADGDQLDEQDKLKLDEVLSRKFVPLPDTRNIEYAFNLPGGCMIVVDSSVYNYEYDTMRCHYITPEDGISEVKIDKFARYRDGGTTTFEFEHNGNTYEFYKPTPFRSELKSTLNNVEMSVISEDVLPSIAKMLEIDLAPEVER